MSKPSGVKINIPNGITASLTTITGGPEYDPFTWGRDNLRTLCSPSGEIILEQQDGTLNLTSSHNGKEPLTQFIARKPNSKAVLWLSGVTPTELQVETFGNVDSRPKGFGDFDRPCDVFVDGAEPQYYLRYNERRDFVMPNCVVVSLFVELNPKPVRPLCRSSLPY